MSDQPITYVQFPRHLGIPNASPFCAKLELWLKLADIPYTLDPQVMPFKAPKKKIPYVVVDGHAMGDSALIMAHLSKTHGVTLDEGLSAQEFAYDTALSGMLDERLYWYIVYDRWLGDGWPAINNAFFGSMNPVIRPLMTMFARRAVRRQLWEQGTGRHTKPEVEDMAARDVEALATIIGDGPFIHGDQIRTVDCVAYSYAANLALIDLDTPMTRNARAHTNLVAYAQRITDRYFPELAKD